MPECACVLTVVLFKYYNSVTNIYFYKIIIINDIYYNIGICTRHS